MAGIKLVVNMRHSNTGNGTKITIDFFDEINLNLKFDSVASTFKFKMFFDSENPVHAELVATSHIHECSIYYVHDSVSRYINDKGTFVNTTDELLITGFMLSQLFKDSATPDYVEIGGYSKPGVLGDCDVPTDIPLEAVGLSFREIVKKVLKPFQEHTGSFSFVVRSTRADTIFEADPDDFLNEIPVTTDLLIEQSDLSDSISFDVQITDEDDEDGYTATYYLETIEIY